MILTIFMTLFLYTYYFKDFFATVLCARSIPWPHRREWRECGFEGVTEGQWRRFGTKLHFRRGQTVSEIWKDRERSCSLEKGTFFLKDRKSEKKRTTGKDRERLPLLMKKDLRERYFLSLSLNFYFFSYSGILCFSLAWLTLVIFSYVDFKNIFL